MRQGVPAEYIVELSKLMDLPRDRFYLTAGLARATIDRKIRAGQRLDIDESERVAAIAQLVGQAQTIVEQSGNPQGFEAGPWIARWLESPHPALGGQRPADYMDTSYGRVLVADLLAQQQTGAYA